MFVKISRYLSHIFLLTSISLGTAQTAVAQEVFIEFPEELLMIEFDKYLLPRFKFKSQIRIRVSSQSDSLDARLGLIPKGKELFSDLNGFVYRLETITPNANQISKLEIPTGNPLLINLDKDKKITECKYLDSKRAKDLVVF